MPSIIPGLSDQDIVLADANVLLPTGQKKNLYMPGSSVVECLTRDLEAAGSSLTGVTALWSLSKTHLS